MNQQRTGIFQYAVDFNDGESIMPIIIAILGMLGLITLFKAISTLWQRVRIIIQKAKEPPHIDQLDYSINDVQEIKSEQSA
ncbi:hypothetical protein [Herpetosiphon sp.]|uniref:hypothetical protein n=1 Tax=Herpetosiphon sp. TaxID=71864 RepID=UPI0000DDF354|nr:hypothetical protein [Herpetosiphon sp.]